MTIQDGLRELERTLQMAIEHIDRLEERVARQQDQIQQLRSENEALRLDIHFMDPSNKRVV